MTSPSQVPVRYPSGVSTDFPWGPLANFGQPNPAMYQTYFNEFYESVAGDGTLATVLSGTGAAAALAAGDGGQILLTSSTAGAGTSGIKGAVNNFFLPPALYTGTGLTATLFPSKKVFFAARVNVTTIAGTTLYAGLMPAATTTALPTDGVFFQLLSTGITLTAYNASTLQWTLTLPTALPGGAYANANWLDIGFYIDRLQNVQAFAGFPLFGWTPASAWTGVNNVSAAPGPLGAVAAWNQYYNGVLVNPWTPTANGLTYGLIATGTTQTVSADFILAAKER
jgi:hypothetical protein